MVSTYAENPKTVPGMQKPILGYKTEGEEMNNTHIKSSVDCEQGTARIRSNSDGMFSDTELDRRFAVVLNAGDMDSVFDFGDGLDEHNYKIFKAFMGKFLSKLNSAIKKIKVYNSFAVLREYGVLIVEDAIQFFKEMKRLKRRQSTKQSSNYYFSGVV